MNHQHQRWMRYPLITLLSISIFTLSACGAGSTGNSTGSSMSQSSKNDSSQPQSSSSISTTTSSSFATSQASSTPTSMASSSSKPASSSLATSSSSKSSVTSVASSVISSSKASSSIVSSSISSSNRSSSSKSSSISSSSLSSSSSSSRSSSVSSSSSKTSSSSSVSSQGNSTGTRYHVAKTGQDSASGDENNPFLTISRAAQAAQAGDTITVHAGIYRERVTPPRGGSASKPITYEAASGESVRITGSEQITNWVPLSNGVYSVTLPDSYFGSFNPYTLTVSGDYLSGTFRHRGCVYLNGEAYFEVETLDEVKARAGTWTVSHSGTDTTISANFAGANPNNALAEINVRPTVFFPDIAAAVDYVVVRGFTIDQAATNWAPPNAQIQEGAIGSLGGAYWTIENSTIRNSRNVCISFGVYSGGAPNLANSDVGHHLVRNSIIQRCGQAGIAGSYLISGSRFIGNLIEDINHLDEWFGYEQANIKFHNAADVLLEGNLIRQKDGHVLFGVWVDWANTNTRFTRNIVQGFESPFYLEENHGPLLFDNNIFFGGLFHEYSTRGTVGVHNLYVKISDPLSGSDTSRSPRVGIPHAFSGGSSQVVQGSYDDKRYNNVYVTYGYGGGHLPGNQDDYNLYLGGAQKNSFSKDTNGKVFSLDPNITYVSDAQGLKMSWDPGTTLDSLSVPLLTSDTFGVFQPVGMRVENMDGSTIVFDRDFFDHPRNPSNPRVGPFATETVLNNVLLFDATTKGAQ